MCVACFKRKSRHQSLHHPFPADERATDALNPKNPKPGVTKTVPGHPAPREVVYPHDQETCPSEFCNDTRSKAVFFLTLPLIDVFSEENEVNSLVSDQPW